MPFRSLRTLSPMLARLTTRSPSSVSPPLALPKPEMRTRPVADSVFVPVREDGSEFQARRDTHARGQFLARQERWDDLSREMATADRARDAAPSGLPIAELLAFGARADVVNAAEHMLIEGHPAPGAPLLAGISALEDVRQEADRDPYITLIVALAHMDIAWAWRGAGWEATVPQVNREKCAGHFDRAAELLSPLCGIELDSPAIASAQCAVMAGRRDPAKRIADEYEKLIDLDPQNFRHMRAMGNHLLPRWFGSHAELELEARRTAARTQDHWGAGGYTWVCFDAIAIDDEACALVDVEFFTDGLRDIVQARPDQETVNLLAAYCAVTLQQGLGMNEDADLPRMQISDCASWLIRDHLTEVHPLIWAHAAEGFDNNARITSLSRFAARGKADALQAIAEQFREDLENGLSVTFTPDGPRRHSA